MDPATASAWVDMRKRVRRTYGHQQDTARSYISIEGKYIHAGPDAEGWSDEVPLPAKSSRLVQLTSHFVTDAARLDASRMKLDFDHGHSLTLVDDTDQSESFRIEARGRIWVVWRLSPRGTRNTRRRLSRVLSVARSERLAGLAQTPARRTTQQAAKQPTAQGQQQS